MKAFCYTENIFGSLCAVGMRIMNSGGPAQNPLSIAPLISITGPIFVHVPSPLFDSCTFFAALLFFPLFFLFLFLATLQFAQCIHLAFNISRRARRSSTFSRPEVGLLVRHLSLPLLLCDRVVPLWAQTRLDPEPWLFSPYPPKLSKWMQPTVPLLYVYTRPPIGTYVS